MAFSFITRFLGRTTSEAAGFGIGGAIRSPLEPPLQELTNETWRAFVAGGITVPTEPGDAAEIVAEDVAQEAWGTDQVSQLGYGADQFDKLVNAVRNAPGVGELLQQRRRGAITDGDFEHGLRKARLETRWDDPMRALLDVLLSPADLANAVVQGHRDMDTAAADAAKLGVSAANFQTLVDNTGLPPGPATLLEWRRRRFIDDAQLDQGIREGHTKTKYIPNFHDALNAQLSTAQIIGLRVKGWITPAESYTLGEGHGFTAAQMDQMWEEAGRPATPHQIHIGYARGATVQGAGNEEEAIRQSVQRSDLQTRYGDIIYAGRYTYPSPFVLRALVTSGDLTQADGEQILLFSGYEPTLAKKMADAWGAGTGTAAKPDPYIAKAEGQLWTSLHKDYVKTGLSRAQVEPPLTKIVPHPGDRNVIFDLWQTEKTTANESPPPAP